MVNAASQHGNQFLEDICHVSLCRFITYLFIEFLELQLGKIFSVIISHFLQLFLSIVWDWKQIVFLPTKLITDIQFFCVFHVYPSFLMYLAHQLRQQIRSDQIRSVTQWCPTLCDPMNRSTPGLPVHHQLPEFTQTHFH